MTVERLRLVTHLIRVLYVGSLSYSETKSYDYHKCKPTAHLPGMIGSHYTLGSITTILWAQTEYIPMVKSPASKSNGIRFHHGPASNRGFRDEVSWLMGPWLAHRVFAPTVVVFGSNNRQHESINKIMAECSELLWSTVFFDGKATS